MPNKEKLRESYKNGDNVINFVIYSSKSGLGDDHVLQHKYMKTEMAHITLHPDGTLNFRIKRNKEVLKSAVKDSMKDYSPKASAKLKKFLKQISKKL